MNRNLFLVALLVGLLPLSAAGQVAVSDDFEDYFPGPVGPSWLFWQGGGVGGGTDPFNPTFPHEISTDGLGEFQQAWKISFDTTDTTDWYWWGTGGGIGYFSPEFPAAGITEGGDDPGDWVYSLDVRGVGALTDIALKGSFTYFDPDYEATFGVDVNDDGDMLDGADTFITNFDFLDTDGDPNGFTSNSFRLDEGTPPTTAVEGDIPRFGNDGTWVLNFFGGGGEYRFGSNSVTIDNIMIEYSEKPSVLGDYNDNGVVDAADYTVWRDSLGQSIALPNEGEGVTTGEVTVEDYEFWKSRFGNSGAAAVVAAGVPEPCSAMLTLLACSALAIGRLRRALSCRKFD